MRKQRTRYTPEQKAAIIRRHLLDRVAVPDLRDTHELHPTVYYRWQMEFFEGGGAAFAKESDRQLGELKRRLAKPEEQLRRKNEVLAEVREGYVHGKKQPWEPLRWHSLMAPSPKVIYSPLGVAAAAFQTKPWVSFPQKATR